MTEAPGIALLSGGHADTAALAADPSLGTAVDAMVAEGFRQGVIGMALDITSYTAVPWGFDPAAVGAPTLVPMALRTPSPAEPTEPGGPSEFAVPSASTCPALVTSFSARSGSRSCACE